MTKKINEKQKRAVDYFIELGNKTQALLKAGYSMNYAKGNATKLFENESVKEYLNEQLQKISSERTADAKEVMEYLTSVMRGESQAEIVVVEGCGDGVTNAVKVSKNPDEKERLKAAELLGKRFGLFKEKVELEAETKGVVIIDDVSNKSKSD